jgi:hypothetical protein
MRKKAMTTTQASEKKKAGHINERHFAEIIGGKVVKGTDKNDVIDQQDHNHSVKGGRYWQIFLYRKSRLLTNTEFQGIGRVANLMVTCLDVFPHKREDYEANKVHFKTLLQAPMRALYEEIRKPNIFPELLSKAIFNGKEVDYLSILTPCMSNSLTVSEKRYHVFARNDVVSLLSTHLEISNSGARKKGDMPEQKVIFRYAGRNIGEIEIRNESDKHYREMKWRFEACGVFALLDVLERFSLGNQIYVRGSARKTFSL